MVTTGLTLGKYSPFHKGHQQLIETALAEVDQLIVVVYNSPETTSIPLDRRADWIRTLYPAVEVLEAWDGPRSVGDTEAIRLMHEEYLLKFLKGREISRFYTAEFYGDHVSRALGAEWRRFNRHESGISGTAFRADPYRHRNDVHPVVYSDFVMNIVFLGAPSTGKSTICEKLAERHGTLFMPEYGREYWEQHHSERRLTQEQLTDIAEGHLERETELIKNCRSYLFTDTNAITTAMFCGYYHGWINERLKELADEAEKRYDMIFVCDTDIPYDDTWDRSGDVNRKWFQQQIIDDLNTRRLPYVTLSGDLEERMRTVTQLIFGTA